MFKANKEMRETIWNINRERSGRLDFIFNGKYFPAEEPKIQFVLESVKPVKLEVDGNLGEIVEWIGKIVQGINFQLQGKDKDDFRRAMQLVMSDVSPVWDPLVMSDVSPVWEPPDGITIDLSQLLREKESGL